MVSTGGEPGRRVGAIAWSSWSGSGSAREFLRPSGTLDPLATHDAAGHDERVADANPKNARGGRWTRGPAGQPLLAILDEAAQDDAVRHHHSIAILHLNSMLESDELRTH